MPDVFTLSDEDFLAQMADGTLDTEAAAPQAQEPVAEPETPAPEAPAGEQPETPEAEAPAATEEANQEVQGAGPADPAEPAQEAPAPVLTEADYRAAYEAVFSPFKANGKQMKVNTPEEALQLMKMGAGFHHKMNKIAPAMRIIETLREHDLLDEGRINQLIDISKKNPEAIRALVQEAGIEPHELIQGDDAPTYQPGNHVLPEDQLRFRTSIENIREQGGEEFLSHVAQDWDVASRAEVFRDPRALDLLYDHKQTGMYDQISSEVERRRMFNPSFAGMPFIHAYLQVGQEMFAASAPQRPVAPQPVAQPAPPTPNVTPNPAAAKAASVRSPAPRQTTPTNYFTMPDEEFLKNHAP